ncbi:unnamed protein product [Lasius platythorax]|uniref:CHHC U11-48K-type domain-containing protein n=1 Tax=Lasius platythorax TaxID=488582 RepID=A0AAV2NH03_9HYME
MEPDIIVTCPYNPAHRIRQYKLMSHIVKCKKSADTKNKVECPLNKSHIVDHDHLREHIATCPSLGNLVDVNTGHVKQETDIVVDSYRPLENWDEEPEVRSYNPMEASANKQVMRCMPGLSKSERKKFRDNERMRIANLKGVNTARTTSLLVKDTVQELPLRPPRGTPATLFDAETKQNDSDKSQINDNLDASTQAESTHEFQNLFYKTLYDKLAPECDDTNQQSEHPLHSTDMGASARDYSQHTNGKEKNLPFFNQNHETKVKKTQLNETFEIFNDNIKKEKNECVSENTSRASERVTDKLLALLKNNSDVKKVESVEEIGKISQNNKDSGERGLKWDDVFDKFNDRLAHLTDIQNAAAEESARLLKQLNELKVREGSTSKK